MSERLIDRDYTVEQCYERGLHAAKLLEDSLLSEAFALAREKLIDDSLFGIDVVTREAARAQVLGLAEVRQILDAIVSGGEHAEEVLRRANS